MFMLIVVCFICFLLAYFYIKRKWLVDSLPPGPPTWPIVGNLLDMGVTDVREKFLQWHKQYGPIFTVWFGINPQIYVTGFEEINQIFVKNGDKFIDRPYALVHLLMDGPYGIFGSSGDLWAEQRKFVLQLLRTFGMGKKIMEESITVETEKMIQAIVDKLGNAKSSVFDVTVFFQLAIANVVSSMLVGKTFASRDDTKFIQLESAFAGIGRMYTFKFMILETFPWLRYVPLFGHFGYDEILSTRKEWVDLITSEIEECRNENQTDEPTNFASAYFKEMARRKQSNEDMGFFSEWQMICAIMEIWTASYDTTFTTLAWYPLLMVHYPEVQKKVQKELDEVVGLERLPNMADRSKLPYTNAVLLELQRYSNIISTSAGRIAKSTITVAGRTIPEGSVAVPYTATPLMDNAIFENADEFKPERFLESDGKTIKNSENVIIFSIGKRSCIGESMAKMELFLFFSALMQKFSFLSPDKIAPSLSPVLDYISRPHPYECRITLRH